jgi:hypothetical protein
VGQDGMTIEEALRDCRAYARQKDFDPAYLKDMLTSAMERHARLRAMITWMPDNDDREHMRLLADAMQGLSVGISKILWPLRKA